MCGIAGFIDFNCNSTKDILEKMSDQIIRRGPDDFGIEFFEDNEVQVGFAFRRLAIIDISPAGHQPMFDSSHKFCIVFNGEVYNFRELRKELVNDGFVLNSVSDTEVVLYAFIKWGVDCVKKLNGMFAFSIYDIEKRKMFLFRDRVGIKPLYYFYDQSVLIFGSELKSLRVHPGFASVLNNEGIVSFLENGSIGGTTSIYKNTYKLKAGHYVEVDFKSKKIEIMCYWSVYDLYQRPKIDISYLEAKNILEELFISAFNYRMIADVPVGVFLSGGYDSTCVAAILQSTNNTKIKTFTIGFQEKEFDESDYAKKVAKHIGTDHYDFICTEKQAIEIIPKLAEIYDEPFADPSAIPTILLSELASKHITVALSADGGDELFAGYPRHRKFLQYENLYKKIPETIFSLISSLIIDKPTSLSNANRSGKIKEFLKKSDSTNRFIKLNETFTYSEIQLMLNKDLVINDGVKTYLNFPDTLDSILSYEYDNYLIDDIMHKVDRATMYNSLEGREPFLDFRIIDFTSILPNNFKINSHTQKVILKDIVHKYVPKEIMSRPKMGFGIPLATWFNREIYDLLDETLSKSNIESSGIFDFKVVSQYLHEYRKNKIDNFQRLYSIFILQNWLNRWM